jgi:hypothetical protein
MCRGLACGIRENLIIDCVGNGSHTDSKLDRGEHLKFEIIIDDSKEEGYSIELDLDYSPYNIGQFQKMVTANCKDFNQTTRKYITKYVKNNEVQFLRWLLKNIQYAKAKENQDISSCEAGGDQYINNCEAGGNQDISYCEAGGDQYIGYCKAGGNQYIGHCEAVGNQDLSYCKAKKRIISYMKTGNKENNEFIKKLSNEAKNYELDWDYLVSLARKGYEVRK